MNGKSQSITLPFSETPAKKSNEAPIRGDVKVSPPIARSDQLAEPSISSEAPTSQHKNDSSYTPSGDLLNKWSILVDQALKDRIALGTMLSETKLVNIKNNSLYIGCPDDFHLDTLNLKRNRLYLQELAQKIYGVKIQLETVLSDAPTQQSQPANSATSGTSQPTETQVDKHPVIQALIREFGVREIKK